MSAEQVPGTPAPATPAVEAPKPAPAAPPAARKGATIGERQAAREARRAAIISRQPEPKAEATDEPDAGQGGAGAESATETAATPEAPKVETAATEEPKPEAAAEAKAKTPEELAAERAERKEAVALAIQRKKLAKRERLLTQRERQFAEQSRKDVAEKERFAELRKRDPAAAARELGLSVREMVEKELKGEKPEPKVKLEELPEELRAQLAELDELKRWRTEQTEAAQKREAEAKQAAQREQVARAETHGKRDLAAFYEKEGDDYPHLVTYEDRDEVIEAAWRIMFDHFVATSETDDDGSIIEPGETLDTRVVFSRMETNAREAREKELARLSKPLRAPAKAGSPNGQTAPIQSATPEPKTLSHSDAASGAPAPARKETPAQKKARIAKRLASS